MSDLLALVETHYEGLEAGDLERAASPFTDDVAAEFPSGPMSGIEALRGLIGAFITAFPGMKIERRNIWTDGDTAIAELVFTGVQTGPLATAQGEVPPSGRTVTFPLIDTFTLRDGKVAEHRVYWDNVSFLTQLGLMPAQADA
ncbi:nuclear transport factor 2 family protein [Nocardia beijingensis]|uniref:ester cyclase n=1 Tax=Nocardia beijingensis TaxID=95162 RepID=UPI001894B43E|nr:nuclear transport factor 2 family protein [Nocardia beijingensis]MBF6074301.1 nuclear transport factor 2 family protein [Nocardia beijingensis]